MAGKNNKERRGQGGEVREGGVVVPTSEDPVIVEVFSVDTDVWIAALLAYAVHPSTRDVRIIVRQ
ncbi:unnamed protein product [Ectocarpus sp. CCAP 1310/34]|nr:unnamed protein product [Ectocarpus sp. CCAP 1310/34]